MALHYNLAKAYALSDNDPEFVMQIVTLFVTEIPDDLSQIKEGIKNKDHKHAYAFAHKVKPTLDLLGLNVAFEEILQVEAWTKNQGEKKEIKETFKSIKNQVNDAVKELKKDFDL
ncbi:histidine kinase [uncultured Flavobacterium sp.]|jgi:HPt (histidine-containing phosphotransfer) domain-containing protein|uniref:Hpt domain-containing protein n=1 Tax=uncultured Flavobacterium sp. TaxID=165435 RepID=UPI0030CA5830